MTGILSREQEFHKINEQLNKMTKYAIEKPQPTKMYTKYSTYTKKGQIAIVRHSDTSKVEDITFSRLTDKNSNNISKDSQNANSTRKKIVYLKERLQMQGIVEEKKDTSERQTVTSPNHSIRTLPSTKSSMAKNTSNIVVRYKNSSFIQSPSLEVLVREENESVRSQATSRSSQVSAAPSTARPKVNLSSEGLVKYLKSRIAILQEEHETLTNEMSNQKDLVEKSVERQKKIEGQRDLAFSRNNTLSEQVTKLEGQLEEALRRLKENDVEHNETRKNLEAVRRELKVMTQNNANLEKRLYRSNEELENTRNTLNHMRNTEKEFKESIRNETEVRDKKIKALNKQRTDLLNAYRKQIFLIDNLKRQNLCMEQSRMIAFGEKEFTKVLDWQTKN